MNLVSVGTNYVDAHQDIARILVTRAQIDLADIVEEFDRKEFDFKYLGLRSDRKKYGLVIANSKAILNFFPFFPLKFNIPDLGGENV